MMNSHQSHLASAPITCFLSGHCIKKEEKGIRKTTQMPKLHHYNKKWGRRVTIT